ncbi:MAG TPA: hypothetical protein VNJ53_13070, partial [Gaiellaceae bacterium]|nr:hypothetical protein [Gaiellaceae bacterium]
RALALPTLALALVVAFAPGRVGVAVRAYALVLAGASLLVLLAALRRRYPPVRSLRSPPRGRSGPANAPVPLARLEQELALAAAWSFDLHHRLRPHLRELAADLLAGRRGLVLDDGEPAVREALGVDAWELLRPDREPPADRQARGAAIKELEDLVQSLERL